VSRARNLQRVERGLHAVPGHRPQILETPAVVVTIENAAASIDSRSAPAIA
jgi:hypothetical protein